MKTYDGGLFSYRISDMTGESVRSLELCVHCRSAKCLHKSRHNANPRKRARCPK